MSQKKLQQINTSEKATSNPEIIDLEIVDLMIANSNKSMLISCVIAALLVYLQTDTSNFQSITTWTVILLTVHLIKKIVATIYSEKKTVNTQLPSNSLNSEYWLQYAVQLGAPQVCFSSTPVIISTKHFWPCHLRAYAVGPLWPTH